MKHPQIVKIFFQMNICIIMILTINQIVPNASALVDIVNPIENNEEAVLLDSIVIDHYGTRQVIHGSAEALKIQEMTTTHPLGGNESLVLELEEVAIVGDSIQTGSFSTGWILDDQLHNFVQPLTLPLNNYIENINSIASGQFDHDLEKELIVVGQNDGKVIIYDDRAHNYAELKSYDLDEPHCMGDCDYECHWSDIATGDFDGDGIDEFVVVLSEWDWDDRPWYTIDDPDNFDMVIDLYIYDQLEDNPNKFHFNYYRDDVNDAGPDDHISQPKVATGELDGDGLDEIVLTTAGQVRYYGWIFEYEGDGVYHEMTEYRWNSDSEGHKSISKNDFVLGDIDGDHLDEIIYLMRMEGSNWDNIWIKDDATHLCKNISRIRITFQTDFKLENNGLLGAGDVDGDGFDEIVVYSLQAGDKFGIIFDDYIHNFRTLKTWNPSDISSYVSKELALGDVDADGMDEILLSTGNNDVDADSPGCEAGTKTAIFDDANNNYKLLFYDTARIGFITTGDFDADGVKLKYTGDHWTTTAPPKIFMAIAAPPTYWGTSHNYIDTDTAFGSETSRGTMEGNSVGVSEGTHWSVGAKAELTLVLFKAEASFKFKKTVTNQFFRTNTKTMITTTALGYTVGYSDDSVIFHRIEFDNYKYEIIAHPTNPDAIGQFLTIDVPQAPKLWKVTTAYYNAKYSSIAPKIGSETFSHTVGKPWTYPNSSSINLIAPKRWATTEMQTLGMGSGFQTTSIKVETIATTESSRTTTTDLEYEFEGSMGIGGTGESGIGGGFYVTAGGGWTSSSIDVRTSAISVGKNCLYEGHVGDIENNETWDRLKYSFALVVYNVNRPEEGIRYQVVNYIVDDAPVWVDSMYEVNKLFNDVVRYFQYRPELTMILIGTIVGLPTAFFVIRRLRRKGRRRRR